MPGIADLDVAVSPRDDPLTYPGRPRQDSYLWWDHWVYDLSAPPAIELGGWQLAIDGGPLADRSLSGAGLDAALRVAGVAAVAARHPVLAYGSNAAPAQLLDKFEWLEPADRVVPVTAGRVAGFALAHSAHVSNPGYVPYVLVDAGRGVDLAVQVLWLDDDQLTALTETEPNYSLVAVNGDRYRLTLESGEAVSRFSAYRGRWGALRWPGERGAAAAGPQEAVQLRLARARWFSELVGALDPPTQIRLLRADRVLRDRVRNELAARGMALADGWIED